MGLANVSPASYCSSSRSMPDSLQPRRKCHLWQWVCTTVAFVDIENCCALKGYYTWHWLGDFLFAINVTGDGFMLYLLAIHQEEVDGLDDNEVRSPFGSSFRTFDGVDYSSIGNDAVFLLFWSWWCLQLSETCTVFSLSLYMYIHDLVTEVFIFLCFISVYHNYFMLCHIHS